MSALSIVFHPAYEAALPDGHRFPMGKYGRLAQVLRDKGLAPDGFIEPEPVLAETLALAHDRAYVDGVLACALPPEVERRIGLPVGPSLVRRSRHAVGGTMAAARLALRHGLAGNTAGGSHHAQRGTGAGFCVLNDVAVAARVLKNEGTIRRALIVDLDVHQGDGTADCLRGEPDLFTFSMHGEKNYPLQKIFGDRDVGLLDGTQDDAYLDRLGAHLPALIEDFVPDLIFYNAGVDPHRDDRLGRLALSDEGLTRRDRFVVEEAWRRGVPLVSVVGGGYASDLDALAHRHAIVFEVMAALV